MYGHAPTTPMYALRYPPLPQFLSTNSSCIAYCSVQSCAWATGTSQEHCCPLVQGSSRLHNKRLISLDVAGLLAGTQYRGTFEERVHGILEEVQKSRGNVMLFIDEVHNLVGAGAVRSEALHATSCNRQAQIHPHIRPPPPTAHLTAASSKRGSWLPRRSHNHHRHGPCYVGFIHHCRSRQVCKRYSFM